MINKISINAAEARFRSSNGVKYNNIIKDINKKIEETCDMGLDIAVVEIPIDTDEDIRERVEANLIQMGYTVEISNIKEKERGCPSDQASMFDFIKISW